MTRICKRCDAELLPGSFYESYKSLCKKCVMSDVQTNKRRKRDVPEDEDVELGVSEILEPDDLYIMQNSRLPEYKVGRSYNPEARAKDLSKSQNFRMHILHVFKGKGHLESIAHQRLKTRRLTECCGTEWYSLDLQTIEKIIEGILAESSLDAFCPPTSNSSP